MAAPPQQTHSTADDGKRRGHQSISRYRHRHQQDDGQHDQQRAGHAYEWKSRGWRASGDLVDSVAEQLRTTGLPAGGTQISSDIA